VIGPPDAADASHDRGFVLDRFQQEAISALDAGASVLVAAPTGSGKTVVAEHAVSVVLATGGRVFYTTPIKALSNQKFHDLADRHGAASVGLLTGDNAINGDAPVVVMTTEVLRNMIYAGSSALDDLRYVVLDEVHYLQDAYRGPVWEEVITHLPQHIRLVCLSATVSNADEVADWLRMVRGDTALVTEERRPIDLTSTYLVEDRTSERLHHLPVLVDGRPNPEGDRFDSSHERAGRGRSRRRFAPPRRVEVVEFLAERSLLPAIAFIFSRNACDDAAASCLAAGLRLTTAEERVRIREICEQHVDALSPEDLDVLGYGPWLSTLEAGVAAHHAGMVPPFKEAVEACFIAGLLRVVFATETLALGVNMPARSVVIEKLTKFTGEGHDFLTPAQFTQLTGRAGRRGIDVEGTAVVLWSPFVTFGEVAGLAASRSFPLTSAFRPTYNMAGNLVRRYEPEAAHHLLNLSLAQYQADQAVVRIETRLSRRAAEIDQVRSDAVCERGDVGEYVALVDAARADARAVRAANRDAVGATLRRLKPGDVVALGRGGSGDRAAVLSVGHRKGGETKVRAINASRRVLALDERNLDRPPEVVDQVAVPAPYAPRSPGFQREIVESLKRLRPATGHEVPDEGTAPPPVDEPWAHPVDGCPDRDAHVKAHRRLSRLERERSDLLAQVKRRTGSIARRFDLVLQLLGTWGYVAGWALTSRGERLVQIFHECDLLVAEALEEGLFDGLDAPSVAALASVFTYEHRAPGPAPEPWFPSPVLEQRWRRLVRLSDDIRADEERMALPATRRPDAGFMAVVHGWASGGDLDEVLADEDVTGGDFVRQIKQLVDLLRQIGDAAADPTTARAARRAGDDIFRGVVAASAVVEPDEVGP